MKWLITGATGQLGVELTQVISQGRPGDDITALSRQALNITDQRDVTSVVSDVSPDVVVNCAAWTKVDLAEICEAEVKAVNAWGPANLAEALVKIGHGLLIQVSTDYVFGAGTPGPHREDEEVRPIGVYARTKALAEDSVREILPSRHAVIRTAWLYGEYGSNFTKTIIERLHAGRPLKIVDDQLGQPTYTNDVARRLVEIADLITANDAACGTFHAVNAGSATWWEFGAAIAELLGHDPNAIERISSRELDLPALRPADSRLADREGRRWGLTPMRPWRTALKDAFPRLRDSLSVPA